MLPKPSIALESFTVASNTFIFNPRTLSYTAINSNGNVVKRGRASGGSHYCRDIGRSCRTPVGSFRVIGIRGADCYSSRYRSRMPYCMFFKKLYAVHGHYNVPGYNASHGCIRVPIPDAKWLYHNFMRNGTRVIVKPY
ncbi:L,D-transpeptidase [Legionella sp. W05-934-2]|uniref:L,D-transpeptidase n=1 Tax=Legionella sp. W05-934-2 TaxID=1198649 RepID=UPI003461E75E